LNRPTPHVTNSLQALLPLDMRAKKTRAIRRRLTKEQVGVSKAAYICAAGVRHADQTLHRRDSIRSIVAYIGLNRAGNQVKLQVLAPFAAPLVASSCEFEAPFHAQQAAPYLLTALNMWKTYGAERNEFLAEIVLSLRLARSCTKAYTVFMQLHIF